MEVARVGHNLLCMEGSIEPGVGCVKLENDVCLWKELAVKGGAGFPGALC